MTREELRNREADWPERMNQADIREEFGHRCEPGCGCPGDPWQDELKKDPDYDKWRDKTDAPF